MKIIFLWIGLIGLASGLSACNQSKFDDSYFPLPKKEIEVVHSEVQSFVVDTVVTGLTRPWSMAFLPDGRMLITERSGNLWVVQEGKVLSEPVVGNVPVGLRDIELHPRYEENAWIYLSYYIEPEEPGKGGETVLMRGRLVGNTLVDKQTLYSAGSFKGRGGEWYGSRIIFDDDGYLFFTVGIRGEKENAQDLSYNDGKTMRLHDDGKIPSDNPFVDRAGALPEIYTYGHRMHEGLVRHPETGQIWSSEHGPMGGDEVNIIGAGLNFGWPEVTHGLNYDSTLVSEDTLRAGMEPPVHHWTPSIAPSGFDFIVGERYREWKGNLFIGSMKFRYLNRSVLEETHVVHEEKLLEGIGRVRSIRQAPDGLLYVLTEDNGMIVRIVPVQ